jgi:hypothetical protein
LKKSKRKKYQYKRRIPETKRNLTGSKQDAGRAERRN